MSHHNIFEAILREVGSQLDSQIAGISDLEETVGMSAQELHLFKRDGRSVSLGVPERELQGTSIDFDRVRIVVWAWSCHFNVAETNKILDLYDYESVDSIHELKSLIAEKIVHLDFEIREREETASYLRKLCHVI